MKKIIAFMVSMCIMSFCLANFGMVALANQCYDQLKFESEGITTDYICRGISSYEDDKPIIVTVVTGAEESLIQVVDVNEQKLLHVFGAGTTGTMWYGTVARDGRVFMSIGNKLMIYSPITKTVELAGTVPTTWSGNSNGIIAAENGVVYGVTSSYGNVYQYKNGVLSTLCKLPNTTGTGGVDYYNGYVYATGNTGFYKINSDTGATQKIDLPSIGEVTGFGHIYTCGKYMIVQLTTSDLGRHGYFYDMENNTWLDNKTIDFAENGMTDICQNKRYYTGSDSYYYGIDIDTLAVTPYKGMGKFSYQRGNGLPINCDFYSGECFVQIQYNGNLYVNSPSENASKHLDVKLAGAKTPRRISRVGDDGKVYVTGFMGSIGVAYDPINGTKESFSMSQGEGAVCCNNKMYIGCYTSAVIYELDMGQPIGSGNPKIICDIDDEQDRPFGMDVADGKLLVGTLPSAGKLGGALSVIDTSTYDLKTYRNLVPEQAILTVTHKGNVAYCGTTASGGSGIVASEGNRTAHVFSFDITTGEIINDVKFSIPGVNADIGAINGLRISPYDGKLYGTTSGIDFVLNPDSLEIENYNIYSEGFSVIAGNTTQLWHESYMEFYNGYLFRTNSIIDPKTLTIVDTLDTDGQFAGICDDRAYFVMSNTDIYSTEILDGEVPWGFTWNYNENSLQSNDENTMATAKNSANMGYKATDDNGSCVMVTASKYGNGNTDSFDGQKRSACYGIEYNTNHPISNDSVVVSTDFLLGREGVGGYILSPEVSDSPWFLCSLYVDKAGHMSMTNGDSESVSVGEIENYKWYNVAIKYTHDSNTGLSADVYLNGEKKASGFLMGNISDLTGSYFNAIICDNIDGYRTNVGRSVECDEGICFDNTYIGNDLRKLECGTTISEVKDSLNEIYVHFNNDVENQINAADFSVLDVNNQKYADVTSLSWIDEKTVKLTPEVLPKPNTEYYVSAKTQSGTINSLIKFKTGLEYLYEFDEGDMNYMARYGRTINTSGNTFCQDSYDAGGKCMALYKIGELNSTDSHVIGRDTGYGIEAISGYTSGYTGQIKIAYDFMLESEFVNGALVFNSTKYDNVLTGIYMNSTFDINNKYVSSAIEFNNTKIADIIPKKWYRLNVNCTRLMSGTLVIESISLDDKKIMTTARAFSGADISKISFLVLPIVFESTRTTNQRMLIDNLYIGPKNKYNESKSIYNKTILQNGIALDIYAGAKTNAATLIGAVYDDSGQLKEITLKPFSVLPYMNDKIEALFTDKVTGNIKTFLIDNLSNIKPYTSPNEEYNN